MLTAKYSISSQYLSAGYCEKPKEDQHTNRGHFTESLTGVFYFLGPIIRSFELFPVIQKS